MKIYETINCFDDLEELRKRIKEIESLDLAGFRFNLSKTKGDLAEALANIKCVIQEQSIEKEFLLDIAYPRYKPRIIGSNFDNEITENAFYFIVGALDETCDKKCILMEGFQQDKTNVAGALYYADGVGGFEVIERSREGIKVRALNSFKINMRKSISFPTQRASLDYAVLTGFLDGMNDRKIGFVLAFVEDSKEIVRFKENVTGEYEIISKIESLPGIEQIDEIAETSDGVLLARGDLAMHANYAKLCEYSMRISDVAKKKGRKLYCATDVLLSLEQAFLPNRAEIIDVSFNIMRGCRRFILPNYMLNMARAIDVLSEIEKCVGESQIS